MNKQDIQLLFDYNRWCNARILGAAAQLTTEQFLAPGTFPHGGLRATLVHALFAEWVWRLRWPGNPARLSLSLEAGGVSDVRRAANALDGGRKFAHGIRRRPDG